MIEAAGGVPFMRSNVPQLLLINESNNWIWGRSENPWDRKRTTGGSSGGEGGLVVLGASPIGIGSDGGGSVRIPALYCGIYGFRPTTKRFTNFGHKEPSKYAPRHIYACIGPLAKCVDDVERGLEAMQNYDLMHQVDFLKPEIPWDRTISKDILGDINNGGKLKVGYIMNFEVRF
jgi:Asp-tRNA(Asn)/Glu-tRNA(Gln) amidotransferase A subunit family amidase